MTKERRQYIMHAIGQKAKEIAPKGTEVILFGSQAREDAHSESDWNVLLLREARSVTLIF